MFAYNKVNMGTGNLLNPSWSGGDGMGGGGFGDGGSSGTSYYYGTGIGQPVPGESYGNFQYLSTSLEYSVGSYGDICKQESVQPLHSALLMRLN